MFNINNQDPILAPSFNKNNQNQSNPFENFNFPGPNVASNVEMPNQINQNMFSYGKMNNDINNNNINPAFNKNFQEGENDWSKKLSDHNSEVLKRQKEYRFNRNFGKIIKIYKNNKNDLETLTVNLSFLDGLPFIKEYVKKIWNIYQDRVYYDCYVKEKGNYNFSWCPFCKNPCIYFCEKVLCISGCFIVWGVENNLFDENYPLDLFIEQYHNFCYKHKECKGDIEVLFADKSERSADFICSDCQNLDEKI